MRQLAQGLKILSESFGKSALPPCSQLGSSMLGGITLGCYLRKWTCSIEYCIKFVTLRIHTILKEGGFFFGQIRIIKM